MPNAKRAKQTKTDANNKTPKKPARSSKNLVWINPYINAEDVAWLESNDDLFSDLVLSLVSRVGEGYGLSVKYDNYSQRYSASLIGADDDCPNAGVAVGVRGSTPYDAVYALGYCVEVKLDPIWKPEVSESAGRWG